MDYLEMLKNSLEQNKKLLEDLQIDDESKKNNKKQINQVKKEIRSLENQITRQEEQKIREKKVKELEEKIPSEIKGTMDYRFAVDGYIMQNSAPNIGDITVSEDGKVTFKYGGLSEVDDGKQVMQLKNGSIYTYEDRKAYDTYDTGENLTNLIINVKKSNPYSRIGEKFSITAMSRARQWSYQENDLYQWKDIDDISELPIEELLTKYSVSEDLQQFLYENFTPIPKKEQIQEKTETEPHEKDVIIGADVLTVDDLKKEYEYVFDRDSGIVTARKVEKREVPYTLHLPDGTTVQKTREENGKVSDHLFFKDKNGIVTLIPELSYQEEGDINGDHYRSSDSSTYGSTRHGSHTFDVHEWGFEGHDEEGKQIGRFDKHYRYVTLDDSQKLVKVFESEHYIDKPWGDLYHRNKDENGKQCIRLVDLAGNIHSIKEGGKVGEKGLKEKTFGPRGDYQLKVVYKDKEPVYALFIGDDYSNHQNEFCTAEELRECYERQTRELKRCGIWIDEESCFAQMEEIIENFNETFMQGEFVPSLDKSKAKKEDKSVTELAEELSELTDKEIQAKQLLEQYEHQLPNKDKEI